MLGLGPGSLAFRVSVLFQWVIPEWGRVSSVGCGLQQKQKGSSRFRTHPSNSARTGVSASYYHNDGDDSHLSFCLSLRSFGTFRFFGVLWAAPGEFGNTLGPWQGVVIFLSWVLSWVADSIIWFASLGSFGIWKWMTSFWTPSAFP